MRIADREIVQPALDAGIPANRKIRLVAVDVERAAMDAADAEPFIAGFAGRQRHRQIVLPRFRPAWAGVQDGIRRELVREVVAIDDVHPLREPRSKRMTWRPHRLRRQRIVIARNEEDRWMRGSVLLKRPCKPFPEVRLGLGIVEQVAGAQHRMHRVASRDVEDLRDHVHPRARQLLLRFLRERREPPPEMPVGRVQQPQHDVSGIRGEIRNDHLEQPGHCRRPVPKLVVLVSPFSVDLVFPGLQRVDAAFERSRPS